MAFTSGQYGPEAIIDGAGNAIIGATITVPGGYTASVDARGNLTITGPAADAVSVTVTPSGGVAFSTSVQVLPLVTDLVPITTASATYQPRAITGDLWFLGDSQVNIGETYAAYAQTLSGGQIRTAGISSYPGQTSSTVLANVSVVTGATPVPGTCVVHCGANDAAGGIAVATFMGNIASIVAALRAARIAPILVTVPPRLDVTAYAATVQTYNVALARYARQQRLPLVDLYTPVVDPATGGYLAAYDSGDHIHPSALGNKLWGKAVVDTLMQGLVPNFSLLPGASGTPSLISNGLFLTDTNLDGIPDGWSTGIQAGLSYALAVDSAFCLGNRWRLTTVGQAAARTFYGTSFTTGFAVGDRLLAVARIRNNPAASSTTSKLKLSVTNYTAAQASVVLDAQMSGANGLTLPVDGVAIVEFTVPATTANIQPTLIVGAGDGTYDLGQLGLYNLTALGVA